MTGFRLAWGGVQNADGHPAGPHLSRQDHRRRPAARRRRRPARRSCSSSRQSAPCTRPARCRGTRSRSPPAWRRSSCSTGPGTYERLEALGAQLEDGLRAALRRHGRRGCVSRRGSMWTLFFGVDAGAQRRRRAHLRHGGLRALLHRHARARRLPAAVRSSRRRSSRWRTARTTSTPRCGPPTRRSRRCGEPAHARATGGRRAVGAAHATPATLPGGDGAPPSMPSRPAMNLDRDTLLKSGRYLALGFQFAGAIVGGLLVGYLRRRLLGDAAAVHPATHHRWAWSARMRLLLWSLKKNSR